MKLTDLLNEKIVIDVEVGDTILAGRFKNKKIKVNSIDKDEHGMPTINGKKVVTFRTMKTDEEKLKEFQENNPRKCLCEKCWKGYKIHPTRKTKVLFGKRYPNCIKNENKDEIKVIHNFLTKHTKSAKKASDMIKKYYKKVKKQFRGDSTRDVAMAIVGYDVMGENKDLFKMYTQAMKMMPGSPKQKELIKKISSLRKKLKMNEGPRKPRKKGQHRNSPNHSDLYTDENPKGTIKGLKFATVKDAEASVRKINSSGKKHAHKIQAAVAMEQRAKEMGKKSQAAVYRRYINKMKEKTKKMNEGWSDKYKKSIDCNNPKGFSQKAHCAGKKKNESEIPSPSRKMVKKMKKKGHTSVPYGSGYKKMIKEMSPDKRAFLMLRIYGDSWKVNLGKVFSGINKQKPGMIKKGLKEIKILNKKIEDMIEDLV